MLFEEIGISHSGSPARPWQVVTTLWAFDISGKHLRHAADEHPVRRTLKVLAHRDHQMAFVFMAMLTVSGLVVFPYLSNYTVADVSLMEKQLPLIYLVLVLSLNAALTSFPVPKQTRWKKQDSPNQREQRV